MEVIIGRKTNQEQLEKDLLRLAFWSLDKKWQYNQITKQVSVNHFSLVSCRNGYAIYLFFSVVPNSHFYQDLEKNWDL